MRWLRRARRLAPNDHAVALTLATVHLSLEPQTAAELASEVVAASPSREAWLCLIAARHRAGQARQAMADLHYFLAHYVVDEPAASLADAICAVGDARGWCGIDVNGGLLLPQTRHLRVFLDDRRIPLAAAQAARSWRKGRWVRVTEAGSDLVGSPIDVAAIGRVEGVAEATSDGGIRGWCWQPSSPETTPHVELRDIAGHRVLLPLELDHSNGQRLFVRRYTFDVSAADLRGLHPPLRVCGPDARPLLGTPLDPGLELKAAQAAARAASPARAKERMPAFVPSSASLQGIRTQPARKPRPAVVIPVFNGNAAVAACLDSVITNTPRAIPIIVIDDGSTDADVIALLNCLDASGAVRLLRHKTNQGFPAAANTGMRAAEHLDVLLLNSDVLTPPGWLEVLRDAAYAAADIGTASPLSNDATLLNYPGRTASPAPPDVTETARIAALVARAAGPRVVDIPTTVGFCMYIRRDCLDDVGAFREDLFAQGYGEENDFCVRARHLGWRHVAALGTYVAHRGGASFGDAKRHLITRNLAILERLHPGWLALVETHAAADPLFDARRRIDRLRWRRHLRRGQQSVILITHDDGGGVERIVQKRVGALAADGLLPVILRPADGDLVRVYPGLATNLPDLRYRMPDEWVAFTRLLQSSRPQRIEYHHMLGHHPGLLSLPGRLGLPYDVIVHDYAWICPRVTLVGSSGHYCGEPDARECDRCVADAGRLIEEDIDTASLRRRSGEVFSRASAVVAPSNDTHDRLRRHFPALSVKVAVHEADRPRVEPALVRRSSDLVVAVVGALGIEKGYNVLLRCARDAADRKLGLRFVLVGHSIDDPRLLGTGRCFVTGPYHEGEAADLIAQEGAGLGLIPSIWPETWCFALSEIWRARIPAACFDIGAPAERIRATGGGFVLPLGLGAPGVNNALLAAARQIGHV